MTRPGAILDLEGPDPLDAQVAPAPSLELSPLDVLLRRRAALGLPAVTPPAVFLVPIGYLLGPQGAGALSAIGLAYLDTVVAVALASIGCLVGMALELGRSDERRALAAATLEASVTLAIVSGAFVWLSGRWQLPHDVTPVFVALALGIAAAASSEGGAVSGAEPAHVSASRIAALDDVVPIVAGGLALAGLQSATPGDTLVLFGITVLVGLLLAFAGWLLFEQAHGTAEGVVYVIGILVALGGAATYLRLSPLVTGVAAGVLWRLAPGGADQVVRHHLGRIQHPLVVMLLLAAGARMVVEPMAVWMLAAFVVFRLSGKILGGWLAARLVAGIAPSDMGAYLLAPGLMGVATVLMIQPVAGITSGTALLTAVALGTVASELLALIVLPGRSRP
jgi:hypothetical protein